VSSHVKHTFDTFADQVLPYTLAEIWENRAKGKAPTAATPSCSWRRRSSPT